MSCLQTEAYSKCNDSISNKDSRLRDEAMLQKSKHGVEEIYKWWRKQNIKKKWEKGQTIKHQ